MAGFRHLSPEEAAALIGHNDAVGFGGFTIAGVPKSVGRALAARAAAEHSAGRNYKLRVFTVSTGPAFDGLLAAADAIAFKTPYQSDSAMRTRVNQGGTAFLDMHLPHVTQALRYGFFGPLDWTVLEAADVSPSGDVVLTSSVGAVPAITDIAANVIIELNRRHPPALRGLHDIYEPADPPRRREIPIYSAMDRVGSPLLKIDPAKIVGIVETDEPDEGAAFEPPTPTTERIGHNVAEFFAAELAGGRIPPSFLPVQSGVGNVANSVLGAMGSHPDIPPFVMYTEIIQDAAVRLMEKGDVLGASCGSLTLSPEALARVYGELDWFKRHIVLRPQEITNHPEVVRRLGLISMNTAVEVDIFGNVNSTHTFGRHMMNGIGGSGDFTRNAYLSIFTCRSTAKGGRISAIVPMASHVDHSEHSVQAVVTEWGVADLRGRTPRERARLIIDNCAHPDYRDALHAYASLAESGHTPNTLSEAFSFHTRYQETGDMRVR